MKEKIQKIQLKTVLIIVAILIAIFSVSILAKIHRLNYLIFNECEPRDYTSWTKEVQGFLTPERIEELKEEIANARTRTPSMFIRLFDSSEEEVIAKNTRILEQGYEMVRVPDEERRAKSEEEVKNYRSCLKNQELAIKQRPEVYKFLFIGDALIIIIGLLTAFAIRGNKK